MKIALADYCCNSDKHDKPIGHRIKVANQYSEMIREYSVVQHYIYEKHNEFLKINSNLSYGLPYCIYVNSKSRLVNIIKKLINIKLIFENNKCDIIWFYCPDFILYFYLAFFGNTSKKIVVTVFRNYAKGKMKKRIIQKAYDKIDAFICSNPNFLHRDIQSLYMPDYFYNKKENINSIHKEEVVICVGTMNKKKKLLECIELFSYNEYPIKIMGYFYDNEFYEKLMLLKTKNVIIENRYLNDQEYKEQMMRAKYTILPYDATFYKERTSGVLVESLFYNCIPICHNSILDFNEIQGIGYSELIDLKNYNFYNDVSELYEKYNQLKSTTYSKKKNEKNLREMFESLE
ncbi:hypothetical protein [Eubacterium callanderi]|uniref:hypothetical protein n=1 Tax=Eubacterium callanderi TaxID=53442 RepID=UPI001C0FD82E|nr:hypothetical protein [Eubacterium callanderi]MBU5305037.1 hypothetical protein [Eubacterium callanderi]